MKQNIDAKGRKFRAIGGLLLLVIALLLAMLVGPVSGAIYAGIAICIVCGLFMLFEAANAWCVLRACGIKTPV